MKDRLFLVAFAAVLVAATGAYASAMALKVSWGPTQACFDPKSPPMELTGPPKKTAKLRMKMVNKTNPHVDHGGSTIAFSGQTNLPYGAFTYRGPCPDAGQRETFEISVDALDDNDNVLDSATTTTQFPK